MNMSYVMSASHLKTGKEKRLVTTDSVPTPLDVMSRRVSAGSREDKTPVIDTEKLSHLLGASSMSNEGRTGHWMLPRNTPGEHSRCCQKILWQIIQSMLQITTIPSLHLVREPN